MKYKLQDCIGARLRRLSRIVDGHFRTYLTDFDITENQMTLLFALNNTGRVDQGILGKRLILERSSISRNINVLQRKGYVERSNEYRPQVYLTKKGAALVQQLIPIWEYIMDKITSQIGDDRMEMISKLEQKLI